VSHDSLIGFGAAGGGVKGPGRTALIFAVGAVLAFLWGLYYVVVVNAGFEIGPTVELLAITAVASVGLGVVEVRARRRRRAA
jgi:hypothetical protein